MGTAVVDKSAAFAKYTDAIESLPEECWLGSLLYFSISQADVNLNQAHRDLKDAGLSTDKMRRQLRPLDAFAKASRRFVKKFKPKDGIRAELMVRKVGKETDEELFRFLILERSTVAGGVKKRVSYDKVGELKFDKGQRENGEYVNHGVDCLRITHKKDPSDPKALIPIQMSEEEDQWLTEQLLTFADNYDHLLYYMDSHAVRTFVREYIYQLGGVCVKESGGLYFVKQERVEEVEKLGLWVRSVGSQFHTIPLPNVEEQRAEILQAFEEETSREVDSLMAEIAGIIKDPSRKIEEKTFDAYGRRAAEMTMKMHEYSTMLDSRAETAQEKIKVYQQQVMTLAGRIKTNMSAS